MCTKWNEHKENKNPYCATNVLFHGMWKRTELYLYIISYIRYGEKYHAANCNVLNLVNQ